MIAVYKSQENQSSQQLIEDKTKKDPPKQSPRSIRYVVLRLLLEKLRYSTLGRFLRHHQFSDKQTIM